MSKLGYAQSRAFTDPSPQVKQAHEVWAWDKDAAKKRSKCTKVRIPTRGFFLSINGGVK